MVTGKSAWDRWWAHRHLVGQLARVVGRLSNGDTYFRTFGTIIGSESLTTVFGMETGVTFQIWSPEEVHGTDRGPGMHLGGRLARVATLRSSLGPKNASSDRERWIYVAKHSSVSTGQLNTLLCLHIRPINLVVFQGTLALIRATKPNLGAGFTLRCFQRLSVPTLAIQPCR